MKDINLEPFLFSMCNGVICLDVFHVSLTCSYSDRLHTIVIPVAMHMQLQCQYLTCYQATRGMPRLW